MKAGSKRWLQVEASTFPHEKEALDTLREALDDHEPYRGWSNLEFVARDGSINEVDALVLTPRRLFLVEIKSRFRWRPAPSFKASILLQRYRGAVMSTSEITRTLAVGALAVSLGACTAASREAAVEPSSGNPAPLATQAPSPSALALKETSAPSEGILVFSSVPTSCKIRFRRATLDSKGSDVSFGRLPAGSYPLVATTPESTLRTVVVIHAGTTTTVRADFVAGKISQTTARNSLLAADARR